MIFLNKTLYFTPSVSEYFGVPYDNVAEKVVLNTLNVVNCVVAHWDNDVKSFLLAIPQHEIILVGIGSGTWEVFMENFQHKPESDQLNNPIKERIIRDMNI